MSKKTKPESAAQTLDRMNSKLRADATADWRRWAIEIASGGSPPDMRELLATASAMGIDDPAAALLDDAQAVADVRRAAEAADLCERTTEELLAPWGGSLDELGGAVAAAERDLERLRATLSRAADRCSRSHWQSELHRVVTRHARVWPNYAATGKAEVF